MITRRNFLRIAAAAASTAATHQWLATALAGIELELELGVCSSIDKAGSLKKAGFQFIEGNVAKTLMPRESDEAFAAELARIKAAELPVLACNGFIPSELRIVGTEAKPDEAVAYATKAIRRAPKAGVRRIVLGSGGAREIPEGFSRDKAREQFVAFCKRLAPIARDEGIIVVLEPLNKGECNFINRVDEGMEIVDAVGHPGFELHADIYHMMKENEGPESILKAGKRIRHVHVATNPNRKPPGAEETDFRPYFKALKSVGYRDLISIECKWKNWDAELPQAARVLRQQLS